MFTAAKARCLSAIVGVGLSTAVFGLLPTIHQVGIAAPIIFLILRLVQGLFVGGGWWRRPTLSAPSRCRKNGAAQCPASVGSGGGGIGALLASVVFLITSSIFPGELFAQWGWRFMFFSGLISSLLGWFIFKNLEESPFFQQLPGAEGTEQGEGHVVPGETLFSSEYRGILLLNLLISAVVRGIT